MGDFMPSISITNDTYQKLNELREKFRKEEGLELSYNQLIRKLIFHFEKK